MSDESNIGFGSKFAIGDGADPEVFTEVALVTAITPPEQTVDTVDKTHMQSPGRRKEYMATLADQSALDVTFNYDPGGDNETLIMAALNGFAAVNVRMTWPNDVTWTLSAIVTSFKPAGLTIDGKMEATVSFKPTGSAFTPGVAA